MCAHPTPLSLLNSGYLVITNNGLHVFSISSLEGSSSQPRLVIVLWPPADLIISQHSRLMWGYTGGELHHPCHLTQHGAVLHRPTFTKGVFGAEKDGGRAHGWCQRLMPRKKQWGSAALQLTRTSRARAEIGECRALLEARKNLEKCLEGSSSGRVTDHKKLSPDTSKDLGVQGWEVNHPHPTIHTPPAS